MVSMFFMCSIVPESSWNWPSIELIRVLRVEIEPVDLSSAVEVGLAECVMECGIGKGDFSGEGEVAPRHFLAVAFPRVETESSSFPYAVYLRGV